MTPIYYSAPVNIRQTTNTSANSTVWAMRNSASSTKIIYIERLELNLAFDSGTPLTRSLQRYDFVRFSAANPTGGTALTVVPMDSSSASTQVSDLRFLDTGLTTTGITFSTPILTIGIPATDATSINYGISSIPVILAPGEGFCIRLNVAAITGQSITGFITWSER